MASWYDDMEDVELKLIRNTRMNFMEVNLARLERGPGWGIPTSTLECRYHCRQRVLGRQRMSPATGAGDRKGLPRSRSMGRGIGSVYWWAK
jgi:hypothetical protein